MAVRFSLVCGLICGTLLRTPWNGGVLLERVGICSWCTGMGEWAYSHHKLGPSGNLTLFWGHRLVRLGDIQITFLGTFIRGGCLYFSLEYFLGFLLCDILNTYKSRENSLMNPHVLTHHLASTIILLPLSSPTFFPWKILSKISHTSYLFTFKYFRTYFQQIKDFLKTGHATTSLSHLVN